MGFARHRLLCRPDRRRSGHSPRRSFGPPNSICPFFDERSTKDSTSRSVETVSGIAPMIAARPFDAPTITDTGAATVTPLSRLSTAPSATSLRVDDPREAAPRARPRSTDSRAPLRAPSRSARSFRVAAATFGRATRRAPCQRAPQTGASSALAPSWMLWRCERLTDLVAMLRRRSAPRRPAPSRAPPPARSAGQITAVAAPPIEQPAGNLRRREQAGRGLRRLGREDLAIRS